MHQRSAQEQTVLRSILAELSPFVPPDRAKLNDPRVVIAEQVPATSVMKRSRFCVMQLVMRGFSIRRVQMRLRRDPKPSTFYLEATHDGQSNE